MTHHTVHTAHARLTHRTRAQTWIRIVAKKEYIPQTIPARGRQELWEAAPFPRDTGT